MKKRSSAFVAAVALAFKSLALGLMVSAPLLGVWVASSLAAYANARMGWVVLSGLLLFPGLPLAWEGVAQWRRSARQVQRPHILTFADRLVLRTLLINIAFLGILVASQPKTAFIALSVRGDWFLRDRHGAIAERVRRGAFKLAGTLEWLYDATHPNPYEQYVPKDQVRPNEPPKTAATTSSTAPPTPATPPTWPQARTLHPLIESLPSEAEQSIESLGQYIAKHETDPMQRVKALHDWVADRVAYDGPAFRSGNIPQADGDATQTFERRLGVCAGYAQLMVALGKVTGDEIVYITGSVRSTETTIDGINHAWNAARIGGTWHLIDATWDAGYLDGDKFTKKYRTSYLFSPPEVFGVEHFPADTAWQLREPRLTRGDFLRQPILEPAFFERHLKLASPTRSQVTVQGRLDITLENPSTYLLVKFGPVGDHQPKQDCTVHGFTGATCMLPTGSWAIVIYGNDHEAGMFEHVGSLEANSR